MRPPIRAALRGVLTAALLALTAAPAGAWTQGMKPYDGTNPFRCTLQQVGTRTAFPEPKADPMCVEYDKTNQNVAQAGIAAFALQEPARFAAAAGKCFYFQHDHWTGTVSQGADPELWHWDGSYFFDLARGNGGVFFGNPRLLGYADWAQWSAFFPPSMQGYLTTRGWGGVFVSDFPVVPRCAAMVDTPAKAARIYRSQSR